jgi:hypothetical protein
MPIFQGITPKRLLFISLYQNKQYIKLMKGNKKMTNQPKTAKILTLILLFFTVFMTNYIFSQEGDDPLSYAVVGVLHQQRIFIIPCREIFMQMC